MHHRRESDYPRARQGTQWYFTDPDSGVRFFHFYHTKKSGHDDEESHRIWELKDGNRGAVCYYAKLLQAYLQGWTRIPIVTIPSSDPAKSHNGIRELAIEVCRYGHTDWTDLLTRVSALDPKHRGGARDEEMERDSLEVVQPDRLRDQLVLLLDDVTTSGTSLRVGRDLLTEHGARGVRMLAIAKTISSA